jgi:hypothetical protein
MQAKHSENIVIKVLFYKDGIDKRYNNSKKSICFKFHIFSTFF